MNIIDQLVKFIEDVNSKGGVKGVNYNAIVLPIDVLDAFEQAIEENKGEFTEKNKFQDLEILVANSGQAVRVAFVVP